jgi:hypothetical protein
MPDRDGEWITQAEASRLLGFRGKSASAVPKLVRRGLLHPRSGRPSLSRVEVEELREAREKQARLRAIPKPPKTPRADPTPPDDHPEWVRAAELAAEMGVGGPWVVHQRARRGRLPHVMGEDGTRWFRRDLVQMAVRAQEATRSKRVSRPAG